MSCLPMLAILGCVSAACSAKSDDADSSNAAATNGANACSAEGQLAAYNKMITQPIVPPRMFAGIDMANGDSWPGLKIEDAAKTLCGANPMSVDGTSQQAGWGIAPNYQVVVEYDQTTHLINFYQLNAGYKGTLDFKSRATSLENPGAPNPFGQHTYSVGVDTPILRDGQPWPINWTDFTSLDPQMTEMFDALMATFAPELPSTQKNCRAEGSCLARQANGEAYFGARPLSIYLHLADLSGAANSPDFIYGFGVKSLPFSNAAVMVKLDDEGPVASALGIGDEKKTCTMKLGMDLPAFLNSCVAVMNDPHQDELLTKKFLGGAHRIVTTGPDGEASGTWEMAAAGTHPNFSSVRFDESGPGAESKATELTIDVRTQKILNEYAADGQMTLAASSLIYQEYARTLQALVQSKMDASLPRYALGDAHCQLATGQDPATWHPASGCTGLEELLVPTAGDTQGYTTLLKPGTANAQFCADIGTYNHCGFDICDDQGNNCVPDKLGRYGSLWDGAKQQVVAVLGGGNEASLAPELRDVNMYVALWAKALVKYLRAAPQSPTDLSSPTLAGLAPADSDITVTPGANGAVSVKYLTKLEVSLNPTSGDISAITFR
jgi:hypothetical protein